MSQIAKQIRETVQMVNRNLITVKVKFNPDGELYTYKAPKTLESKILLKLQQEEEIYLMVNSPQGRKIVTVISVDDEPDLTLGTSLKWIAGIFETQAIDQAVKDEESAIALLMKGAAQKAREQSLQMYAQFLNNQNEADQVSQLLGVESSVLTISKDTHD